MSAPGFLPLVHGIFAERSSSLPAKRAGVLAILARELLASSEQEGTDV